MATISVRCSGGRRAGWTCVVTLREHGIDITRHRVAVQADDVDRLAPNVGVGADGPTDLVKASFMFLLEREAPESILGAFELSEISRYFPEYEAEIRARLLP